jgi:hypothetical protein
VNILALNASIEIATPDEINDRVKKVNKGQESMAAAA